jgi:NAD(P)H-dependent FMN reductase
MFLIISGTDRSNSNTRKIANHVLGVFQKQGADVQILDLADLKPTSLGGPFYGSIHTHDIWSKAVALVEKAQGIYVCAPEYNGSMPGALKTFIDHWNYPKSFEFRPVAFCGLGGMWGGLRTVEHLQGVFGFRNSFMYPERVFVRDVYKLLKEGPEIKDPLLLELFQKQVSGFLSFVKALQNAGLDANSR